MSLSARGMYEDGQHYFERLIDEKGFLSLTPLEELAIDIIADLQAEITSAQEEARDWEVRADEYESEAYALRDEVAVLEDDLREAQEECGGSDETTQDDEVEFLRTMIADLEAELAAIDNGAAA